MSVTDTKDQLPEIDREFLDASGYDYEIIADKGALCVILKDFELPDAYTPTTVELLAVLPSGYPNAKPDMFFTRPDVKLKNGSWPERSQVHVEYAGRSWQRWSRHFQSWRMGVDRFQTYLRAVKTELNRRR